MTIDFSGAKNPIAFLDNIRTNKITIKQAKDLQEDFNNYLKLIRRRKKTEKQSKYINMLFNGRSESIKFVKDYGLMILEAKKKKKRKRQQ